VRDEGGREARHLGCGAVLRLRGAVGTLAPGQIDTFNDKQSQIAERKTGDGRGPGDGPAQAQPCVA